MRGQVGQLKRTRGLKQTGQIVLLACEVNPESEELRYKYNLIFFFSQKQNAAS